MGLYGYLVNDCDFLETFLVNKHVVIVEMISVVILIIM